MCNKGTKLTCLRVRLRRGSRAVCPQRHCLSSPQPSLPPSSSSLSPLSHPCWTTLPIPVPAGMLLQVAKSQILPQRPQLCLCLLVPCRGSQHPCPVPPSPSQAAPCEAQSWGASASPHRLGTSHRGIFGGGWLGGRLAAGLGGGGRADILRHAGTAKTLQRGSPCALMKRKVKKWYFCEGLFLIATAF